MAYTETQPAGTDFEKVDDLNRACGDNAQNWAAAFKQFASKLGHPGLDEEWLIGWFANAIETANDVRHGGGPVELPDGSGVFVS